MNESIEKKVRKLKKSKNKSINNHISTSIEEKTDTVWSSEVQNLCVAWSDFPSLSTLRENESATDVPRESL
jgi:hypothetical protein